MATSYARLAGVDVPPAIELVWDRGPGASSCIDAEDLAQKVGATLGRPVRASANDRSRLQGSEALEGRVDPLATGGWIAVVAVRGDDAASLRREVTLDAPDCRQLDEALVLVVALMADAPLPRPPPLVVPKRGPTISVAIGPDLAVASGMLPGIATAIGFASDVAIAPYWHIAAWAHAWPALQALDPGSPDSGARLTAWTFGASPCAAAPEHGRWSFFGCAGASGGVVYASGVGVDVSRSRARPYLQVEVRAGVRWRVVGPFFLRLEGGAGVPVARDWYGFHLADGTVHEVFRTAPVVPLGRFGIEFRAP